MKALIYILVVVAIAALSSCGKQELIPISIHHVDDTKGLAYGTTQETENAAIYTYEVTTTYNSLIYDSAANQYYLDMDKYGEGGSDTLCSFVLQSQQLLTAEITH